MKFMTTCLMPDERADLDPPASGRMDGFGSDTVDIDYFLRRPRAALEHWGVEGLGLFGTLRFRFALGTPGMVAPAAR